MIFLAKFFVKVLKVLNSEVSPNEIAAGFAFGALVGLIPVKGLLPTVLLLISFIININLAMVALATLVFKLLSFILDPLANQIGYVLLTKIPALKPFWTHLYNLPIVPYTRFNNTIVLGSLVIGLILLVPLFFVGKSGVVAYRTKFRERFLKLRLVQFLQSTTLYRYYESYEKWKGE